MEEKPIGYLHMKFTVHGKFLQKTLKLLLKLFKLRCFGIMESGFFYMDVDYRKLWKMLIDKGIKNKTKPYQNGGYFN